MTKEEFLNHAFKFDEVVMIGRRSGKVKAIDWVFDEIKVETSDENGLVAIWYSYDMVTTL